MNVLFEDANIRIEHHPLDRVLVGVRKASAASAEDVLASMRASLAVETSHLGPLAFILDVRAVMGRNDEGFERATMELRRTVAKRATRFVTLVATMAGALQTRRLSSQEGGGILIATSEEEAFRLARGEAL
ncbi:MAG: hypothetical protein IPG81_20030 [Sandaracinaceae bacterium]|nr:hypothetical protein [Sandaracinaceae bacterium]